MVDENTGLIQQVMATAEKYSKVEGGYRKALYACAEEFYAAALEFETDTDQFERFKTLPDWTQRKIKTPKGETPPEWVLRFGLQGDKTKLTKWHTILAAYRDDDLASDQVAERIDADGGFEKAYSASKSRRAPARKVSYIAKTDAATDPPEKSLLNFDDFPDFGSDFGEEPEHDKVASKTPAAAARNHGSAAEKKTGTVLEDQSFNRLVDTREHLVLSATDAQIRVVRSLAANHSNAIIRVTLGEPDADDWIPIIVELIEPEDSDNSTVH